VTITVADRICLIGGHYSEEGQALSSGQLYNLGTDIDENVIIKPLGGAWKRPGTLFKIGAKGYIRFFPFDYDPGKVVLAMIAYEGIIFGDIELQLYTDLYTPPAWLADDVGRVQMYVFENFLYIYMPRVEGAVGRESGRFWRIAISLGEDEKHLEVNADGPLDFISAPYVPIMPARGLKFTDVANEDTPKVVLYMSNPDVADVGTITDDDVGRTILIFALGAAQSLPENQVVRDDWAEYRITNAAEDGTVTLRHLSGAKVRAQDYYTRRWLISAFTSSGDKGGRIGSPTDMVVHQGRLWLVKDSALIGGRVDVDPLDFSIAAEDESSAITKLLPSHIYWMMSSSQLIVGCVDGIYVVGTNTSSSAGVKEQTIGLAKLYNIAPSPLKPVFHTDGIIFVGSDGYKIYKIEPNEQNFFRVGQINAYAEDLTAGGVVAHVMQFSPYKIYWVVTADGRLLSCVFADTQPLHRWTYHKLGGEDPYVMNIAVTRQKNEDSVWILVRRVVNGVPRYSIDYISKFYNGLIDDPYTQTFMDSCISFDQKTGISQIYNGTDLHCTALGEDGYPGWFINMLEQERGNLQIYFANAEVTIGDVTYRTSIKYDPVGLQYYGLDERGFSIDCNDEADRLENRHTLQAWDERGWFPLFGAPMYVADIENFDGGVYGHDLVRITFRDRVPASVVINQLWISFFGMTDISEAMDGGLVLENVFKLHYENDRQFVLMSADRYVNVKIRSDATFKEAVTRLSVFVGYFPAGFILDFEGQELPRVNLNTYYPTGEGVETTERNFRFGKVPGATKYGGQRVRLKRNMNPYPPLTPGQEPPLQYFIRRYPQSYLPPNPNTVSDEKKVFFPTISAVPKTSDAGVYEILNGVTGEGMWHISWMTKEQLSHLVDTEVSITWNGGIYVKTDLLSDDKFSNPDEPDNRRYYSIITEENNPSFTFCVGYPYAYKLSPVPLVVPTQYGSGDGAYGEQRLCQLKMRYSQGGIYSADENSDLNPRYRIPYKDRVSEEPVGDSELYSGVIAVKIEQQQDPTRRTIYIEQTEPVNFVVLNIIQDVNTVDR
jgi:hypothetical protein